MSSRHASRFTSADCSAAEGVARVVVAEQRHADRARVEPQRVRTDHVARHAARPALVDGAEAVDEEVVTDVVPAVSLHVVDLDPPHDGRRLGRGVGVRGRGVVHDGELERRRVERLRARDLLVGLPLRAGHDPRHAGELRRAHRLQGLRLRPEVVGAQPRDAAEAPELHALRRARPVEVPVVPAGRAAARPRAGRGRCRRRPCATRSSVRRASACGSRRGPRPASGRRAC